MAQPQRRQYTYRITLIIGPAPHVPRFGPSLAKLIGYLKRAGHDITVEIQHLDDPADP